jgi:hypothetical protein
MFGHTSENKNYFEWVWVWSIMIGGFPFSAITGEKKKLFDPFELIFSNSFVRSWKI